MGSMPVYHSVLNVKALVGSFNQEKALVGAFSVIVKTDGLFYSTRTVWTGWTADSDVMTADI